MKSPGRQPGVGGPHPHPKPRRAGSGDPVPWATLSGLQGSGGGPGPRAHARGCSNGAPTGALRKGPRPLREAVEPRCLRLSSRSNLARSLRRLLCSNFDRRVSFSTARFPSAAAASASLRQRPLTQSLRQLLRGRVSFRSQYVGFSAPTSADAADASPSSAAASASPRQSLLPQPLRRLLCDNVR